MIQRFKKWLVGTFLPERAARVVYAEVAELERRLELCQEQLAAAGQKNELQAHYIAGLERSLRSRQVNITVKGGADICD
ncbi:hypothetical protein LJC64_02335 [Ruminococcaceae bacterium OttesenSCG-928-A11]|nr:hypothetical protein [Ruminococcaceae bacterium OttesenSCG-928-A11]